MWKAKERWPLICSKAGNLINCQLAVVSAKATVMLHRGAVDSSSVGQDVAFFSIFCKMIYNDRLPILWTFLNNTLQDELKPLYFREIALMSDAGGARVVAQIFRRGKEVRFKTRSLHSNRVIRESCNFKIYRPPKNDSLGKNKRCPDFSLKVKPRSLQSNSDFLI